MAFITRDFVKETSSTTGTGNIVLAGARAPGQRFATVCANGDQVHYAFSHDTLNQWEVGVGTYNAGADSITRTTTIDGSSGLGVAVNFSAGTKRVDLVEPASRIVQQVGPVQIGATSFGSGTLSFQGTGISFSLSTNSNGGTVHASVSAAAAAGFAISAIGNSVSNGTVIFSNANNVSFGMVGASVTATVDNRIVFGNNVSTVLASLLSFSNANGATFLLSTAASAGTISLSHDGFRTISLFVPNATHLVSVTAATDSALSAPTLAFPQLTNTTGFSSANVFFRLSSDSMLAVANFRFNAVFAANATFVASNGVTFGVASTTAVASAGNFAQITASFSPRIGIVSHIGGQVASSVTQLVFSDANNVTWSLSTAASAVTVLASVAAGGGGGITAFNLTNSVSSVAATRLEFINANGVSWLLGTAASVGSVSISYSVPAVVNSGLLSMSNSVSAVNASALNLSAANGFSFLLSTAASGATLSGSYTVPTLTSLSFSNLNGVTFGTAGSTLTASINQEIGVVSHIAGNVVSSVRTLAFSNASNVTFSLSTAANAATVIASVAAAGGGANFSFFQPFGGAALVVENQYGQNSLVFHPVWFENVQFDRYAGPLRISNGASTSVVGTFTATYRIGLYTRGSGASSTLLSLLHSTSNTFSANVSSSNNSSLYGGLRMISLPWTTTVTRGDYWFGFVSSTASAGVALVPRNGMISQSISDFAGFLGSSNATFQLRLGNGFYTATTGSMPGSVAFSQINAATSNANLSVAFRPPALIFMSGSA
jgi:hypothetical protein